MSQEALENFHRSKMPKLLVILVLFSLIFDESLSISYQESIGEMLIQCNSYQSQIFDDNRTSHQCEKENFSEDFSYVIETMETRYSKQKFLCFLFLKDDYFKLKFKLWFSHENFAVDAVSKVMSSARKFVFKSQFYSTALRTTSQLVTNGNLE